MIRDARSKQRQQVSRRCELLVAIARPLLTLHSGHAILDAKGKSLVVHTGDAIRRLTLHSLTLRGTFGPPAPRVVNPPESRILGYIEDHTRFVAGTASHHAQIIDIATGAVEELPRFPELEAMQVVSVSPFADCDTTCITTTSTSIGCNNKPRGLSCNWFGFFDFIRRALVAQEPHAVHWEAR